jgi:Kef-type K+ transport system membrane component KefB
VIGIVRKLVTFAVLVGLVWLVEALRTDPLAEAPFPGLVTLVLGFILLAGHIFARLLSPLGLPLITGYLLAGVLLGPRVLGLVSADVKDTLYTINEIALGLIALGAGGELAISRLKPQLRAIGWVTLLQTGIVFCGTAVGVALFHMVASGFGFAPPWLTAGLTSFELVAATLILALVATANSPASTVAVIDEERARGPLATLGLGVTVLKDVAVIILMAVTLSVTANLLDPQESFAGTLLLAILFELAVSIGLGALLGGLLIAYLAKVNREPGLFLLAIVLLTIEAGGLIESELRFHLHFLVVCVVAGFVVENFSARGDHLIRALKKSSLPVYVIFFTLTGVGLDLGAVALMWPLALGFAVWRALLLFASTWAGAKIAGEPAAILRSGWTPFLTQAGVSLGLAELVAASYPGIGTRIRTLVVAVVALNQLVGPVLFKRSLRRVGESGKANGDGA